MSTGTQALMPNQWARSSTYSTVEKGAVKLYISQDKPNPATNLFETQFK